MQNCYPPPSFRFSNVEECGNTLAAAGFDQVTLAEASRVWRFPAPDDFFDGISPITVRTAALLCGQTAENLSRIRATAEDEAATIPSPTGRSNLPALLANTRKF